MCFHITKYNVWWKRCKMCIRDRNVVNRACKGGVLSMAELLELARALRNFRELTAWYHITEHEALCIDDHFYAMTPQPSLEKAIGQAIVSPTDVYKRQY